MSAATLATITCDAAGCRARWPGTAATADLARQIAGGQNWRRVAGRDYCPRHAYAFPPPTTRPACAQGTLETCGECGQSMHRGATRMCRDGHPVRGCAGLCQACRKIALADPSTPRRSRRARGTSRNVLLDAWVDLAAIGVGFTEFARQQGMSQSAWERAFQRAREDRDPRALRFDRGEIAA